MSERSIRPDRSHGDGIVVARRDGDVAIFSHGSSAMALIDPEEGRFLEVNDAWVARYGWARHEAHRMRAEDVCSEPRLTEDAALAGGGGQVELRWHKTKSGEVFPVELASGTLQVGGRVLTFAVIHDISRRTEAEASLHRSEARFRALSESLPLAILVHRGPQILYANPTARAIMGVAADADFGHASLFDLIPPEDQATALEDMAAVQAGTPKGPRERRFVMPDGSTVWGEISAIPFDYDGDIAILVMVRDLREQKRMEAQLMLADRLASLGRLAASVGHEINNPLAYMLGNVQMLQRDLRQNLTISEEDRADLLARLTLVEDGAMRVRDIVHDLKGLSVGDRITVGAIDLHRVLDLCANMAEHEIRNRATLVRDYGPAVSVRASEARVGQVFLNLLVNAAHAVLGEDEAGANEIRVTTRRVAAGTVLIEVRDTGVGIAAENMERIFEPFFTTKEHAGTGLGLSISHAIVTAMGGTITVEAQRPRGTCFRVTLPCEPEAAEGPP